MNPLKHIIQNVGTSATLAIGTRFEVYEDTDREEGKGSQVLRHVVMSREDADVLAVGLGIHGDPGQVRECEVLLITSAGGTTYEVPLAAVVPAGPREDDVAARALRKLTFSEREALRLVRQRSR